jgi:hypothetical protein
VSLEHINWKIFFYFFESSFFKSIYCWVEIIWLHLYEKVHHLYIELSGTYHTASSEKCSSDFNSSEKEPMGDRP